MALSEAKKAADKRYVDKLDNIMIRPYREEGAKIRAAAAADGMSVQAYVLRAVRAWIEREQAGSTSAGTPSAASPERTAVRDISAPGDGFGISAGSAEEKVRSGFAAQLSSSSAAEQSIPLEDKEMTEGRQLPHTRKDEILRNSQDAGEEADDWRARLSRSPNRARTIKVIRRITETPRDGDKSKK